MTSSRSLSSALVAALLLAGCTRGASGGTNQSAPSSGAGSIAYVQMDELVKKHPLYAQLAHVDEGISALQMRSDIAGPQLSPQEIGIQEKALKQQLDDAAKHTDALIKTKQLEYAKRENDAMRALLASVQRESSYPPQGSIRSSIAHTQQQQSVQAQVAAQTGLQTIRDQTLKSAQEQLDAAHKTLADRANALYRAKAEELQQKESSFSLAQSAANAAERLTLRTKLSNLALDDSERTTARARLDELDRQEADGLAALRNRDSATLLAYHGTLDRKLAAELSRRRDDIQKRTTAQLSVPPPGMVQQLSAAPAPGSPAGAVPADLRAKLAALHAKYQADFDKDTKAAVADFTRTRNDLSQRFARLHGVDAGVSESTQKEMDALKKQRSDLYDQIVAEIDSEVRVIAQRRGINVVVGSIVAPAGGVDLTPDAAKVVETLHE